MGSVLAAKGVYQMSEVILIALVLIFLGVREYYDRKERKDIYRMLMSKTAEEAAVAEVIEKQPKDTKTEEPDVVPMSDLTDEEWDKANGIEREENG